VEAASIGAVPHRLVLQVTLTTLVTNGAVEGMVGEQELHDTLAGFVGEGGVRLDDHAGLDGPGAGGHRLGCPFDLHQAHAAVSSNHQLLMVAVSWYSGPRLLAGLDEGGASCL
jgi:hypothetical protein